MSLVEDEKTKIKKMGLTYLYYYHENYKTASVKEKREIRGYYDKELRYKNAFYRDKKQFEKFGHPSKWETRKINRFVVSKRGKDYAEGEKLFITEPFKMYSINLIRINISKQLDIDLINIIDGFKDINTEFPKQVKKEILVLKNLMKSIDSSKGIIKIKLKFKETMYNLENLQIIFKLQINTIIRHISTVYQKPKNLEENAVNKLNTFLRTITNLEGVLNDGSTVIGESNVFPEDFDITSIKLIGIELNKRTNLDHRLRDYRDGDYFLSSRKLETRVVKDI